MTVTQSPKKAALPRAERDSQIVRLRALGQPHQVIADRVGCGEKTVRRVVKTRLAELAHSITLETQQIRAQHLLEMAALRARLAPVLAATDPGHRIGAVRAWLQLLERESRLVGLDQPMKLEMAAQSAAAEALLQTLADRLAPDAMDQIVSVLTDAQIDPGA